MREPEDGVIRRSLRRFSLGRGPLKRRSDRIQVFGRFLVVLSFLISPPIAVAVTSAMTVHLREVAEAEAAERSPISATLLEDADARDGSQGDYGDYGVASDRPVPTRAVWTAPDGTQRNGLVRVPPRTSSGTSVEVWVDRDGDIAREPQDPAGISGTATAFGLLPLIGVPLAAWTLYAILTFALDAHRERRWGEDWAEVEPDWHSRLL
jgi:hypothetical protein